MELLEKKINDNLAMYGFTRADLTDSEYEQLVKESEAEINGMFRTDGILSTIDPYRKKK